MAFKQGWYTPRYPEKYVGNVDNIRYMSGWELRMHSFLDNNPNILKWSSEEVIIPYIKPTDGKVHRYFPDYWIMYKDKEGNIKQEIIEVKPSEQTRPTRRRNTRRKLYEQLTYAVNMAKWEYARKFCDKYRID